MRAADQFIAEWARETANLAAYQMTLDSEMLSRSTYFFVPLRGDATAQRGLLLVCLFHLFGHSMTSGHELAPEVRVEAVVFSCLVRLSPARDQPSDPEPQFHALFEALQRSCVRGRESARA